MDSDKTLILNVGGVRHEIPWLTLASKPNTKLGCVAKIQRYYRQHANEYFFNRSPRLFDFILNYYRTGDLHMSKHQCATEFATELAFWEIKEDELGSCCWLDYKSQRTTDEVRKEYEDSKHMVFQCDDKASLKTTCWNRFRARAWAFLDDPFSSKAAMAFSVVSLCVLFVSIFSLCASTDPAFKKNMTFEQYAVYFGVEPVELAQAWHDTDYWSMFDWSQYDWFDYSLYYRNYTLSDGNHSHSLNTSSTGTSQSNTSSHWYEYPSYNQSYIQNTSFNVGVTASNTPSTVTSKSSGNSTHLYSLDSLLGAPNPDLMLTDRVCYIFFALEIIARFIFCPSWKKFFTSILNWLDIILIVFYVTEVIINRIMSHEQFHMSAADILFFFRVFRVLRIFRLANHHKGVEVLVHTLKASMREIGLLVLFLFVGVLIFSCLIYFTDHDAQKFKSIGHSFWWAIITMTTVGYGDMYPETAWGKVVGTACALAGVLMIAFTVPIIVNNFMMFYELIEFGKTPTYGNQGTTVSTAKLPSRKVADSTPSHVGAWA